MRLTEAQLKKYIDYIRRELEALAQLVIHLESDKRISLPDAKAIAGRIKLIERQVTTLERAI